MRLVSARTINGRLHCLNFRLRGWYHVWLRLRLDNKCNPAVHTLLHSDGRVRVYHRPLERFVDYCLQRYDRVDERKFDNLGSSHITLVDIMGFLCVEDTLNALEYIDTVLTKTLSCLFMIHNETWFTLQQRNACTHTLVVYV